MVAFVVAVLMAPLFYAVICLGFDLVNLVVPAPNLVAAIGAVYKTATHNPGHVQWFWPVVFVLGAAAPGLLWMALVIRMLSRVLDAAAAAAGAQIQVRPANREVLAEQRFVNVIEEMTIAAGLPAPQVLVTRREMLNAAVFAASEHSATILVSESLLATLDRQEMQGVAANLVASIADGDLTIGQRIAVTISLFGVMARFSSVLSDEDGFHKLWRLLVVLVMPNAASAQPFVQEISDPFAQDRPRKSREARRAMARDTVAAAAVDRAPGSEGAKKESNWRLWLWLPFAGPVVMSGFFAGCVSLFVLRPLVGLTWRKRKYMADAVAVRLTRDPDALASALERMGSGDSFAPWMAHLSVVSGRGRGDMLGGTVVPMFPSLERRLRELRKMGASVMPPPRRPIDWRVFAFGVPLLTLLVVLVVILIVLLSYVSIPMSALFTGVPFALVHLLLRALGH
jgi:Zn-dependent protease with chaperone function